MSTRRSPTLKKHFQFLGRFLPHSYRSKLFHPHPIIHIISKLPFTSNIYIYTHTYSTLPELSKSTNNHPTQSILASREPSVWTLWDYKPASTYTTGRIAITGDAAHATTPYQGQDAGQAIENALILSTLLAHVFDSSTSISSFNQQYNKTITNALLAYDQVRRVRTQRVVSTNRDVGRLVSMQAEGIEADLGKMCRSC